MAPMLTFCGRRYENGEPVRITVDGERIAAVEPAWPASDVREWPFVAPALFDVQINGRGGTWFGKAGITPSEILGVFAEQFRFGVTRICPTVITNSFDVLHGASVLCGRLASRERWAAQMAPGFHLEGPYISGEDGPRGAHPREHVRPPDWKEFEKLQQAAGGRIRLVTLAPELPGATDFIRRAVASGVTVALGTPRPRAGDRRRGRGRRAAQHAPGERWRTPPSVGIRTTFGNNSATRVCRRA